MNIIDNCTMELDNNGQEKYSLDEQQFGNCIDALNITITQRYKSKETIKTIDFEKTIDLLNAEINSLKDAYHQETMVDRKTVYSSMILEYLHAKKKLKE